MYLNPRIVLKAMDNDIPDAVQYILIGLVIILLVQTIINNFRR